MSQPSESNHISNTNVTLEYEDENCLASFKKIRNKIVWITIILFIILIPSIICCVIFLIPKIPKIPNPLEIIKEIIYFKNQIIEYKEKINKNISIEFSDSTILRETIPFHGHYFLNIYDINTESNNIKYYAYAGLINLSKNVQNSKIFIGGNDILNNEDNDLNLTIIKFIFDDYGNKYDFEIPESRNDTLIYYVKDFIDKIIISIQDNENNFNAISQKNNNEIKKTYYKDENGNGILDENEEKTIGEMKESKEKRSCKTILTNKTIYESNCVKEYYLESNENNQQIDFSFGNFTKETQGEYDSILKNYINNLNISYYSNLAKVNYEINENKTKNINEKIKNIKFIKKIYLMIKIENYMKTK